MTPEITALDVMDEGFELYRATFAAAAWRYYLGSLPFALLLVWDWWQAATLHWSATRLLAQALLLAAAYLLRVHTSGRYLRALHAHTIGGGSRASKTRWRWDELFLESWTGAAMLALWLLSWFLMIAPPLVYVASQYLPLLASERRLRPWRSPREAMALSARWFAQQWLWLGMIVGLCLIVLLNLAAIALALPGFLHALLGLDLALARPGALTALLANPGFWVALLAASFLAVDPALKATLVISFVQLRAHRSGADLEAAIGRERSSATAVAGFALLLCLALPARALPPAPTAAANPVAAANLQRAIQAELQRPEYQWHGDQSAMPHTWMGPLFHTLLRPFARAAHGIASQLGRFFHWIAKWLRILLGLEPADARPAGPPRPSPWADVAWVLAGFALLLALGILLRRARIRRAAPLATIGTAASPAVDVAIAAATELPEDDWFALALRLQAAGDFRLAFRAVFLAGLAGLAARQLLTICRGRTNREYGAEFHRRLGLRPHLDADTRATVVGAFRTAARSFDEVWYGNRRVDGATLAAFTAINRELLDEL